MKQHCKKLSFQDTRGISLIEALIASGIFILAVAALGSMGFSGLDLTRVGTERAEAVRYAQEGIEATRAIRAQGFVNLTAGAHGIATSSLGWIFSGTQDTRGNLVRHADVTLLGSGRARIDVHVGTLGTSTAREVLLTTYLHDIYGSAWTQTTAADFLSGGNNGTEILPSVGDGGVGLKIAGDWSAPKTLVTADLAGTVVVNALQESGGTLFAGSTVNGAELALYDLANVSAGVLPQLRTANIGANVNAIAVVGEYAYLATAGDTRELVVVRIKDGVVVNQLDLPGTGDALSITATGTTLYIGRISSAQPELSQISIATPEGSLPVVRTLQMAGDANALAVGPSGHVLVASSDNSGEVVAVNPATLTVTSALDLLGNADARALALTGNTLYVGRLSSSADELASVDVGNPVFGMTVTTSVPCAASVYGVSVGADGMIAVAQGLAAGEVALFAPVSLAAIGTFDVPTASGAQSVLVRGAYIYAGMNGANPEIVALRGGSGSWEAPIITGGYDTGGNIDGQAIWSDGTRAYLGTLNQSSGSEFYIFDVTNPANPVLLGSLDIGAAVNNIVVSGTYAYLATANTSRELTVVNIANPVAPTIVGSYNAVGNIAASALVASGTTIFLATNNNSGATGREVYAINVAVPSLPSLLGGFEVGANVNGIAIKDGRLLLATANDAKELVVVNATNPSAMSEIASYNAPNTGDGLSVAWTDGGGGFLSLGTQDNGSGSDYYQFTLAPNGTPILKSFLDLAENNNHIAIANDVAFIANNRGSGGLTILDVGNVSAPVFLNAVNLGGIGNSVYALPQTAYLANTANPRELTIVRPTSVPTLRPKESWFTSSTFDAGGSVMWQALSWSTSGTGTVQFQLRSAGTQAGLASATWVGPGGVSSTLYTTSGSAIQLDPGATGTRWIQYRATLEGDAATTPILEGVTLTYN